MEELETGYNRLTKREYKALLLNSRLNGKFALSGLIKFYARGLGGDLPLRLRQTLLMEGPGHQLITEYDDLSSQIALGKRYERTDSPMYILGARATSCVLESLRDSIESDKPWLEDREVLSQLLSQQKDRPDHTC